MKTRIKSVSLALSAAALIGIAVEEGYRYHAYTDIVGVPTAGFGTTSGVKPGDTLSVERALIRLGDDVNAMEQAMRRCIGGIPLYQHEWDAYVSLTYNIGHGAFCKSTLVKKLHQEPPDYLGACQEILRWNRAGGHVVAGLVKRRQREFHRCIGD